MIKVKILKKCFENCQDDIDKYVYISKRYFLGIKIYQYEFVSYCPSDIDYANDKSNNIGFKK